MDRLGARVLRLLHLRASGGTGVPDGLLPGDEPDVAIVASFATFGVGYIARPVGGFVLGHWGDKHGRKNVLTLCMLIIGLSTFAVGLIPSYSSIGVWAPILLVACA